MNPRNQITMEVFSFLKIVKESIKLLLKNGKLMASITLLTLLLQSLLFLPLIHFHGFLTKKVNAEIMDSTSTPNQIITFYLAILLLAAIPFMLSLYTISSWSLTAAILVAAGEKSSLRDLFSRVKRKRYEEETSAGANPRSIKPTLLIVALVFAAACLVIFGGVNAITITICVVVGGPVLVLSMYALAVAHLAAVVWVVEEGCGRREAVERAEKLVVGHRLDGFMINLFVSLVFCVVFLCYWSVFGGEGYLKYIRMHGLFFLNSLCVAKIFGCVAHTVLYFHCKELHGQEIDVLE